jgi:hypothetical protein
MFHSLKFFLLSTPFFTKYLKIKSKFKAFFCFFFELWKKLLIYFLLIKNCVFCRQFFLQYFCLWISAYFPQKEMKEFEFDFLFVHFLYLCKHKMDIHGLDIRFWGKWTWIWENRFFFCIFSGLILYLICLNSWFIEVGK